MIKAVLMDMDGTLYDTEHLSGIGWLKAAKEYGSPLDQEHIWLFRGRCREQNAQEYARWYNVPVEQYWEVRKIRDRVVNEYLAEHGVPIKPGLFELLKYLKENNIRTCIATGTARETAQKYWEETGILPYIDAEVCGSEVVRSKPHPEVFLKAAELVETPPEECLVLEDSPNGARAARAAGCRLIVIPDETPADDEIRTLSDFVVPSLTDVIDILEKDLI